MDPQKPQPDPVKKSSVMTKAFEKLKAKAAAAAAAKNASPLTKLNDNSESYVVSSDQSTPVITSVGSSVVSSDSSTPVITNVLSYSFSSEDGSTITIPLGLSSNDGPEISVQQFLPPRSAQTNFMFASHMVLNVPVSDPTKAVQRDYVAYVFKLGTIFIPGNDILAEWKSILPSSPPIALTFFHDDLHRKSYNALEIKVGNLAMIRFFKPGSAVELLKSILSNQAFFVQESALSRVYKYFNSEYQNQGMDLITYARYLLNVHESVLNVDGSLIVAMIKQTQDDLQEVQVMNKDNSVNLWNELEQYKIDNKEGLYSPLTTEQEDLINTCPSCLTHFQSLTDRIQHWQLNLKCKEENLEKKLSMDLLIGSAIQCKTCKASFTKVHEFCLHRDSHRFRHRFHVCIYCTQLFPSVQSFVKHHCTKLLNSEKVQMVNDGVPDLDAMTKKTLMTCPFCNEEPFPLLNSLIIHLFVSVSCFRQFLDKAQKLGKQVQLNEIVGPTLSQSPVRCSKCSILFQNQVAFLIHNEHHMLTEEIKCKCQKSFSTSCSFSRHDCSRALSTSCLICFKLNQVMKIEQVEDEITDQVSTDGGIEIKNEPLEVEEIPGVSHYNQKQSLWKQLGAKQNKDEWFLCVDCDKLLLEADNSMDEHFTKYADHFRINPAWWYSRFRLYIPDIRQSKKHRQYFDHIQSDSKRQKML